MTALTALWLPILLSAVFMFIVSSIIHMAPLGHKNDYPMLQKQDDVMNALRPMALPSGEYMLPRPQNMKDMRTPEFKEKFARGPVLMMTVIPNSSPGAIFAQICSIDGAIYAFITAATFAWLWPR
jgi:hypothetical protein